MPSKRFELPTTYHDLIAEAEAQYDDGFTVKTPDPVPPTFVDELIEWHYPTTTK